MQAAVQRAPADTQSLSRAREVPAIPPQRLLHRLPVQQCGGATWDQGCGGRCLLPLHVEKLNHFLLPATSVEQQGDSFHQVGQLSDISGPGIGAAPVQHAEKDRFLLLRVLGQHPFIDAPGDF